MRVFRSLAMLAVSLAIAAIFAIPATAQVTYPTNISGVRAQGHVNIQCSDTADSCAPTTSSNPGSVALNYRTTATGAATPLSVLSLGTTAATAVKASGGRVVGLVLVNTSAALRSVKFFNVAVGSVTMGTTAAAFEIDIPAGASVQIEIPGGIGFATAISYAVTSAKGLTDNTATGLAASDVSGVLLFS